MSQRGHITGFPLGDLIKDIIFAIGDDPNREGVLETPVRVIKAWREWFDGYEKDPALVLKTFEDGAELCGDEMVVVESIDVQSFCEHHMIPFYGKAWVGYIPDKRVVGLSKLARVVDIYAHRLQVQERLTNQIANAINDNLHPKGVGVVVRCQHFCMCSRGVRKQGSWTTTSALRGAFKDEADTRSEFMGLVLNPIT